MGRKNEWYIYGDKLNQLMSDRNMSPNALASEFDVPTNVILNWMTKDRTKTDETTFKRLCDIFAVSNLSMCPQHDSYQSDDRTIEEIGRIGKNNHQSYGQISAESRKKSVIISRTGY